MKALAIATALTLLLPNDGNAFRLTLGDASYYYARKTCPSEYSGIVEVPLGGRLTAVPQVKCKEEIDVEVRKECLQLLTDHGDLIWYRGCTVRK